MTFAEPCGDVVLPLCHAAEGCFSQYVKRGQLVTLDEVVCKVHTPHTK